MVNDDLLKVKMVDVERETQETFMRRVKVRPFTFPQPIHPWKVKVKSESTSFHFSGKVKVPTFTFWHQQCSPAFQFNVNQSFQSESTFFHSKYNFKSIISNYDYFTLYPWRAHFFISSSLNMVSSKGFFLLDANQTGPGHMWKNPVLCSWGLYRIRTAAICKLLSHHIMWVLKLEIWS